MVSVATVMVFTNVCVCSTSDLVDGVAMGVAHSGEHLIEMLKSQLDVTRVELQEVKDRKAFLEKECVIYQSQLEVGVCVCTCVCMCICVHVYIHICMCMHAYMCVSMCGILQ